MTSWSPAQESTTPSPSGSAHAKPPVTTGGSSSRSSPPDGVLYPEQITSTTNGLSYNPRKNPIPGARSVDARKNEPVDGNLRGSYTWSPKLRGNMRPKIKVRGYMVNFRPFFAHIPPQFSPPTLIYPRSFPPRGHTFVVKTVTSQYRQVFRPQPQKEHGRKKQPKRNLTPMSEGYTAPTTRGT